MAAETINDALQDASQDSGQVRTSRLDLRGVTSDRGKPSRELRSPQSTVPERQMCRQWIYRRIRPRQPLLTRLTSIPDDAGLWVVYRETRRPLQLRLRLRHTKSAAVLIRTVLTYINARRVREDQFFLAVTSPTRRRHGCGEGNSDCQLSQHTWEAEEPGVSTGKGLFWSYCPRLIAKGEISCR